MKPRVHSSLLLVVTLVIGMILGALVQSHLRSSRMKHFRIMHDEERFVTALEEAIVPASDAQATEVRAILATTAGRIVPIFRENRELFRREMEDMLNKLQPLLDEEQFARLENRLHPPKHPRDKKTTADP